MNNGPVLRRAVSRGINELYQNNHNHNKYNDICASNIEKLWKKYLRTIAAIVVSMSIAHSSTVYLYCMYGERATMTELKIPLIDEGSDMEFKLNACIQALYAVYMFLSNIGVEGISILLCDGISLSSKLIKLRLDNLPVKTKSKQFVKCQLKSEQLIVLQQIDRVNIWIREYFEGAYWRYFLSPIAFSYAIGISIYCQYVVSLFIFGCSDHCHLIL